MLAILTFSESSLCLFKKWEHHELLRMTVVGTDRM